MKTDIFKRCEQCGILHNTSLKGATLTRCQWCIAGAKNAFDKNFKRCEGCGMVFKTKTRNRRYCPSCSLSKRMNRLYKLYRFEDKYRNE